ALGGAGRRRHASSYRVTGSLTGVVAVHVKEWRSRCTSVLASSRRWEGSQDATLVGGSARPPVSASPLGGGRSRRLVRGLCWLVGGRARLGVTAWRRQIAPACPQTSLACRRISLHAWRRTRRRWTWPTWPTWRRLRRQRVAWPTSPMDRRRAWP